MAEAVVPLEGVESKFFQNRFFLIFVICFLSVASQLRVANFPIGPSEFIFLASFVVFAVGRKIQLVWRPLTIFWCVFLLSMGIGLLSGVKNSWAAHNGIAYVYALIFSVFMGSVLSEDSAITLRKNLWFYFKLSLLVLSIGFIVFLTGQKPLMNVIGLAEYPGRFTGWSVNPNQLAFFFLPLPLLILSQSLKKVVSLKYCFLFALLVFIGLCVRSDALFLSWVGGVLFYAILHFFKGQRRRGIYMLGFLVALGLIFGLLKFTLFTTEHRISGLGQIQQFQSNSLFGVGYGENKVGIRAQLWSHATQAWLESPVFGNGPGIFSYYENKDEKVEAHNLLLDVLTQGGIFGALILIGIFLFIFYKSWKKKDFFSLSLLSMVLLFSSVHFMLRQPLFSFYLLICLHGVSDGDPFEGQPRKLENA